MSNNKIDHQWCIERARLDVAGVAGDLWYDFLTNTQDTRSVYLLFRTTLLPDVDACSKFYVDEFSSKPFVSFSPTSVVYSPLPWFVYGDIVIRRGRLWKDVTGLSLKELSRAEVYVCGVPWGYFGADHDEQCWCWSGRMVENVGGQVKLSLLERYTMVLSEAVGVKLGAMMLSNGARGADFLGMTRPGVFPTVHAWIDTVEKLINIHWRAGVELFGMDPAMMDVSDSLPYAQGYDMRDMSHDVYEWMYAGTLRGEVVPGYWAQFGDGLTKFWEVSGAGHVKSVNGWLGVSVEDELRRFIGRYDWVTSGGSSVRSRLSASAVVDGSHKRLRLRSSKNTVAASLSVEELVSHVLHDRLSFKAAPKPQARKLRAVLVQDLGNYLLDKCLWGPFEKALKKAKVVGKVNTTLMSSHEVFDLNHRVFTYVDAFSGDISTWDHLVMLREIVMECDSRYDAVSRWHRRGAISDIQWSTFQALFELHRSRLLSGVVVVGNEYVRDDIRGRQGVRSTSLGVEFRWRNGQPSGRYTTSSSNGAINFAQQHVAWNVVAALDRGFGHVVAVQGDDLVSRSSLISCICWFWVMNMAIGSITKLKAFSVARVALGTSYVPTVFLKMFGIGWAPRSICGVPWRHGVSFRAPWTASAEVAPGDEQFGVSRLNSDVSELRQLCSRLVVSGWCRVDDLWKLWERLVRRYEIPDVDVYACLGGMRPFDELVTDGPQHKYVDWSSPISDFEVRLDGLSVDLVRAAKHLSVSAEKLSGVVPVVPGVKTGIIRRVLDRRWDHPKRKFVSLSLRHDLWSEQWPDRWWGAVVRENLDLALSYLRPEDVAWLTRKNVSRAAIIELLVDGFPRASAISWKFNPAAVDRLLVSENTEIRIAVSGLSYVTAGSLKSVAQDVSVRASRRIVNRTAFSDLVLHWSW